MKNAPNLILSEVWLQSVWEMGGVWVGVKADSNGWAPVQRVLFSVPLYVKVRCICLSVWRWHWWEATFYYHSEWKDERNNTRQECFYQMPTWVRYSWWLPATIESISLRKCIHEREKTSATVNKHHFLENTMKRGSIERKKKALRGKTSRLMAKWVCRKDEECSFFQAVWMCVRFLHC